MHCCTQHVVNMYCTGSTVINSCMLLQAGTLRSALHCLSYITAAVNPAEWAPALRAFTLLLRYSTDARPKVRKRAQYGLVDVLAALQNTPALQGASDAVLNGQFPCVSFIAGLAVAERYN